MTLKQRQRFTPERSNSTLLKRQPVKPHTLFFDFELDFEAIFSPLVLVVVLVVGVAADEDPFVAPLPLPLPLPLVLVESPL